MILHKELQEIGDDSLYNCMGTICEYYGAVTPQIRQAGNRLSGLTETACASLLA